MGFVLLGTPGTYGEHESKVREAVNVRSVVTVLCDAILMCKFARIRARNPRAKNMKTFLQTPRMRPVILESAKRPVPFGRFEGATPTITLNRKLALSMKDPWQQVLAGLLPPQLAAI